MVVVDVAAVIVAAVDVAAVVVAAADVAAVVAAADVAVINRSKKIKGAAESAPLIFYSGSLHTISID